MHALLINESKIIMDKPVYQVEPEIIYLYNSYHLVSNHLIVRVLAIIQFVLDENR